MPVVIDLTKLRQRESAFARRRALCRVILAGMFFPDLVPLARLARAHQSSARAGVGTQLLRTVSVMAIAIPLAFAPGCGETDVPELEMEEDYDESPSPSAASAASAPIDMGDIRPPSFEGVGRVDLVGLDLFELSWEPATDDGSDASEIYYKVYHIVEPYEELDDDTPSLFASEPGATTARLAHDSAPGRFYVRAVDAAGNHSPVTSGLLQRQSRPLLRASDGTLAARITQCAELELGRALCVGEDGFIGRWEFNHWEPLDLGGIVATLRIASTPSGLFVFTELGHLFVFDDEGSPQLIDVTFPRRQPELPFRQFTADHLGLRYWLDAEGRVFVGADREFVPMTRPLALPGEECRRLQGLTFSPRAAFAACNEGIAYSANPSQPRFTWLSLTPNANFEVAHGFRGVLASNDTEGLLYDETGIRRVGVGGWTPILLVDWNVAGVHPMDIPDDAPPIGYISQVFRNDEVLRAATDLGLLEYVGASWELVDETEGALAGVVRPPEHDSSAGDTLIYSDGGVGQLRGRRRNWLVERDVTGFERGWKAFDEVVLATREQGGLYAWDGGWREVVDEMPGGTIAAVAGSLSESFFAYGADEDGVGAIWRLDNDEWVDADWLYEVAPEPDEDEDAAAEEFVFEDAPPPPLVGVDAEDALPGVPLPGPFVHVDVRPDGRAVGVTSDQVWWRMRDGWRLVHQSDAAIHAGFVDAGETWVIITESGLRRCWRDECEEEGVPAPASGPDSVQALVVDGGGWAVVDADGRLHRFVPAELSPGEVLIEPGVESPVGAWEQVGAVGRYGARLASYHRLGSVEVLLTDGGELFEREGDEWVLQAEGDSLIAALPAADSWGVLTDRGLFQLGAVRPAAREIEPEETSPE